MENENTSSKSIFNNLKNDIISDNYYMENDKKVDQKLIFDKWQCCDFEVKNHLYINNLANADNLLKNDIDKWFEFYLKTCSSGVGMVFTEGIFDGKLSFNKGNYLIFHSENNGLVNQFKEFNRNVHAFGTKLFLTIKPMAGRGIKSYRHNYSYSPSFNRSYSDSNYLCARISDGTLNEVVDIYKEIALFAKKSNFDGVMIDATLFNILGEMTSNEFNRRVFGYYSENNELLLKIIKTISENAGEYPIFIKISPCSFIKEIYGENTKRIQSLKKINTENKEKNFIDLLTELVKTGTDGFIFDFGTYETEFFSSFTEFEGHNLFLKFYSDIKESLVKLNVKNKYGQDVYLFYKDNCKIDADILNAIKTNTINSIDLTRNYYSDTEFLSDKKMQKVNNICIKCCYCNDFSDKYRRIKCAINPIISGYNLKPATKKEIRPVAIIGAGVAGIVSAIVLAERGFKVDLYEQNKEINTLGKDCCVYDFDIKTLSLMQLFEQKLRSFAENGKINIFTNTKFLPKKEMFNGYSSIIIATGFNERFLNVTGAVLKNVKSIYEVLHDKKEISGKNTITILAKSELSFKLAMYLLKQKKKVNIIIPSANIFSKMPNAKVTYYAYALRKLRAKVFMFAKVKKIEEDAVDLIVNNNLEKIDYLNVILNSNSKIKYSFLPEAKSIDSDIFIYEPDLYPNNKLYYELIKNDYYGELFLVGNALEVGGLADDIHSAFFVANNI